MLDTETGELIERRLLHADGEAQRFYEALSGEVLVGIESSGNTLWFERLLAKLGHKLLIGDPAAIRASNPRKQKCDPRDARHLLTLLEEKRFPTVWVPSLAERDLRQLLKHRHTLVQMRTRAKNQLQHIVTIAEAGWSFNQHGILSPYRLVRPRLERISQARGMARCASPPNA